MPWPSWTRHKVAANVVFGAIEYAHELGFEPHPDFAGCASLLGPWEGSSDITFGREGKPMYIQGPHDDATSIIRTLRRSVGDDNFHYICQIPDSGTATCRRIHNYRFQNYALA